MDLSKHLQKSIQLLKAELEEQAIQELNLAISLDPQSGEAYALRADAWKALRRYEQALKDYEKADDLGFDQCRTKLGLGICQSKRSLHSEALNSLTNALIVNPQCAEAYYWRGRVHFDLKSLEAAIADLSRANEIDKDHQDAKSFLSLAQSTLNSQLRTSTLLQSEDRMTSRYFLEAHPNAKSLLNEPFFWTYDDFGPVGGDLGADCLEEIWDWRKSNPNASMKEILQAILREWGYSDRSIKKVATGSVEIAIGKDHQLANMYDDAVIAISFCQFMVDGYLDSALKSLALKAIDRQSAAVVQEFRAGDNKDYASSRKKIKTALLAMSDR